MVLVLPVASLRNANLAELQHNSATCPVAYNTTHLTAHVSLSGRGTEAVVTRSTSPCLLFLFHNHLISSFGSMYLRRLGFK